MNTQSSFRTLRYIGVLVSLLVLTASAVQARQSALSPIDFKALLDQHRGDPDVVLLDVRTPREFKDGHIEGALLLDFYANDFEDRLKNLDKNKTYLIYCRSGNRSGRSLALFEKWGFHRAYHLDTGIIGWSRKNFSLVR